MTIKLLIKESVIIHTVILGASDIPDISGVELEVEGRGYIQREYICKYPYDKFVLF